MLTVRVFLNVARRSKIPVFVSREAEVGKGLVVRKEGPSVSKTGEAVMLPNGCGLVLINSAVGSVSDDLVKACLDQ
jgi:hypothetical protein